MVLIRSSRNDKSTNDIIAWILYLKGDNCFVRLNDEIEIDKITINISNENIGFEFKTDDNTIDSNNVSSYVYRRGNFSIKGNFSNNSNRSEVNGLIGEINKLNTAAFSWHQEVIEKILTSTKRTNNNSNTATINKGIQLLIARKVGLRIPKSIITNDYHVLKTFVEENKKVVIKPIRRKILNVSTDKFSITGHLRNNFINASDDYFLEFRNNDIKSGLPDFAQEYINKKFELRIFYFKEQFFSVAIFSQNNEKTINDLKNYDKAKPNRCIPYLLPKDIEQKIKVFMKKCHLDSGSIDMIYTFEGEYYFLEVNPVGQYQWLEKNCNYPISKIIATDLLTDLF